MIELIWVTFRCNIIMNFYFIISIYEPVVVWFNNFKENVYALVPQMVKNLPAM